jgi:hypothetical protein
MSRLPTKDSAATFVGTSADPQAPAPTVVRDDVAQTSSSASDIGRPPPKEFVRGLSQDRSRRDPKPTPKMESFKESRVIVKRHMRIPDRPPKISVKDFTTLMVTISVALSKFFASFRRNVSRVIDSTVEDDVDPLIEYNPDERGLNDMMWYHLIKCKMVFVVGFNMSHLIFIY